MLIYMILFILGGFILINMITTMLKISAESREKAEVESRISKLAELSDYKVNTSKTRNDAFVDLFFNSHLGKLLSKFPILNQNKLDKIERDLKYTGLDESYTAKSYITRTIMLLVVVVGISIFGLIFIKDKMMVAVMIPGGFLSVFMINRKLQNKVEETNQILFNGLPDFIRITRSFLLTNKSLTESIRETIPFVNKQWQALLSEFVEESSQNGERFAIERLKEKTQVFEIKDFCSFLALSSSGGDPKKLLKTFEDYAQRIDEMKKTALKKVIANRKMQLTLVLIPILLSFVLIMAVPMVPAVMDIKAELSNL